jgi:hypothetical protein
MSQVGMVDMRQNKKLDVDVIRQSSDLLKIH